MAAILGRGFPLVVQGHVRSGTLVTPLPTEGIEMVTAETRGTVAQRMRIPTTVPEGRGRVPVELNARLNERVEEEARRIANALHDEAAQMLASVYLAVAEIATEVPAARERLNRIPALLDQVTEHLRRLSHELRPVILDDLGLVPALEFLAQGITQRTGLGITIVTSIKDRLPPFVETVLYRIVHEALTNVSKHARAKQVIIGLERTALTVYGSVQDDGIGFDLPRLFSRPGSRGLGLVGMRERLGGVGGTLSIRSQVGQGTTLEIMIPCL
jgi:signal transduction histidine kinase